MNQLLHMSLDIKLKNLFIIKTHEMVWTKYISFVQIGYLCLISLFNKIKILGYFFSVIFDGLFVRSVIKPVQSTVFFMAS